MRTEDECLFPPCNRVGVVRGLCLSHYNNIRAYVRRGKTTFAELESNGKILPRHVSKQGALGRWILDTKQEEE